MSRVQELESRLREIMERARDWHMVPVKSSPGIFVVKAPGEPVPRIQPFPPGTDAKAHVSLT